MSRADLTDFRRAARDVSNWGRWGADDELGTLNFITADKVAQAASLVRHGKVFPLGVDFGASGPQGAFEFRHNPVHIMTVDGGDVNTLAKYGPTWPRNRLAQQLSSYMTADNPFRFNDDIIIMPLQAASQWDALSHVYYDDYLYNGFPADSVTSMGAYHCGIDKVDVKGITSRGVLLDLVRHRGADVFLEAGNPISPEELDDVVRAQGVTIGRGDIVLIRTGWWTRFLMTGNKTEGYSGLDWRCAQWLHDNEIAAVAADNLQVEDLESGIDGITFPLHLLCLRDMGMIFGEYWDLTPLAEDCAADGVYEFQLVAPPLSVVGGVGSPVNPIAIK
jgi:kynurenine formamidase